MYDIISIWFSIFVLDKRAGSRGKNKQRKSAALLSKTLNQIDIRVYVIFFLNGK